ncbi:hypothetical protein HGRIS_007181 [Hohenbuehelia grisea]|uniref:DUF6534 domain-containing protein n=1 Tax=Hohenbuehelia grisea TaxID=104357 RepID=A0ABR3JBA9_9AGAR
MTSASVPLQLKSLDDTFGAGFIGALVTGVLYGITTLQTYFYYVSYPKDSRNLKLLVSVIWFLDTVHFGFVCHTMYWYLVTNFANPPALAIGNWSLFVSVILNLVISLFVQTFFALRIFRLCSPRFRWWLVSLIGLLVVAHFCFGIETVIFLFIKKEFRRLSEITLFAAMPFALFAVLSDIVIAISLCVLLHSSRTSFRKTNALVTTLIIYAINRCLLTSVVAVAEVIAFAITPKSLWFLAIDFVIGKLYANSLLATLNARSSIRGTQSSQINSVGLSNLAFEEDAEAGGHVIHLSPAAPSVSRSTCSPGRGSRSSDKKVDDSNFLSM